LSPIVPEEDEEASKSADEQFENGEKLDGKKNITVYIGIIFCKMVD